MVNASGEGHGGGSIVIASSVYEPNDAMNIDVLM